MLIYSKCLWVGASSKSDVVHCYIKSSWWRYQLKSSDTYDTVTQPEKRQRGESLERSSGVHLSSWLEGIPKSPLRSFRELSSIFSCTVTRSYCSCKGGLRTVATMRVAAVKKERINVILRRRLNRCWQNMIFKVQRVPWRNICAFALLCTPSNVASLVLYYCTSL